jgi:hypothetical protein
MMRFTSFTLALLTAMAGGSASWALVVIEDFNNYTTGGNVAAFADAATIITAGPNDWTVDVTNGGFGFHFDDTGNPPSGIDISGNAILELDVTVNSGGVFGTTAIVVLEDINGVQDVYDFGVLLGNLPAGFSGTLSTPLTLPVGFLTTNLTFFHVQANSFDNTFPFPYSITFEELRVVVPEPSTMLLLASGGAMVFGFRRRR